MIAPAVLWFWFGIVAAPPPTPAQAVQKVQTYYATVKQVATTFHQEVTNPTFGRTETSDGRLWIQKPGRMRWDYYKKGSTAVRVRFVADGKNFYMNNLLNKRIVKQPLSTGVLPVAVAFLVGKGDLRKEFTPSIDVSGTYGTAQQLVIALAPRRPSAQYKRFLLVVDPADGHVIASIVIDPGDHVNRFTFGAPDTTTPIAAGWFAP